MKTNFYIAIIKVNDLPQLCKYFLSRYISLHFFLISGRIAAGEGRFNSNSEVNINTEVKSIPVTKKGVYFAFRDQGACISLLAIKVRYENFLLVYIFHNMCIVCTYYAKLIKYYSIQMFHV